MPSGSPRLTIARRELGSLRKERTTVLALAIQLFVAMFSSFLVADLVSLYDPDVVSHQVDVTVAGGEEAVEDLLRAVRTKDGLSGRSYTSTPVAMAAFHEWEVDAVLEASTREDGRVRVTAVVPDTGVETTAVVTYLHDALRKLERTECAEWRALLETDPLSLPPAAESSPYFGFTCTVLVPLLLSLPVFTSGSLVVDSLTEKIARGTLEFLRIAPVSFAAVVDGKLLATGGLAPVRAVTWMLLLHLNGTAIKSTPWLFGMVIRLSAVVVTLGAAMAITSPNRRVAQLLYSTGVPLVFAGTSLLPLNLTNTAARLTLGTAGVGAKATVTGLVFVDIVTLVDLRVVVDRVNPNELG